MKQDSLQLIKEGDMALVNGAGTPAEDVNIWLIVAIIEFLIIVFLLLGRRLSKPTTAPQKIKEQILKEQIDFGNIVKSGFGAVELYDKLKIAVHPDRFPCDDSKQAIATELMQLTVQNKHNLKTLEEIKVRAQKELNINI